MINIVEILFISKLVLHFELLKNRKTTHAQYVERRQFYKFVDFWVVFNHA